MKPMMTTIALTLMALTAHAGGDRVGNGGGLWACQTPAGELRSGMLVDLYEARTEFELPPLQSQAGDARAIADERWSFFRREWPQLTQMLSSSFETVLATHKFTTETLNVVDDSLHRFVPNARNCPGGQWTYVQFANFTENGTIWISRDVWTSPMVPEMDKAALLWHEAVYHFLRRRDHDRTSVRTRQIVGYLFSSLPVARIRDEVTRLLQEAPSTPTPAPQDPTLPFICMMKTSMGGDVFAGEGATEAEARDVVLGQCRGERGPFFCTDADTRCDRADSMNETHTCKIEDGFFNRTFTGTGRSRLEAEYRARQSCGHGSTCSGMPRCSRM